MKMYDKIRIRAKFFLYLIVLGIITVSCGNSKSFKIDGEFKKAVPTPLKLYLLLENGAKLIDSVDVKEGNEFKLTGVAEDPAIYLIKYFNDQKIYLVVHPKDHLKISIDNLKPEITYYLEGSADSKYLNELIRKQNIVLKKIDHLSRKLAENPDDFYLRKDIDFAYAKLLKDHKKYTIDFIYSHPQSLTNIMALYQNFGVKTHSLFDRYEDIKIFNFVDSNLIALYPGSESVKILDTQVAETKEQIKKKKYYESAVTEGRILPSFQDVTITGDTVSFPGRTSKLNVLFFWASWNSYSAQELLNLDKINKASGNQINIITVSIDNSIDELKKTITNDSINLPVICDSKYWDSELVNRFSVRRIPSIILTNSDGMVIGKDIFSSDLQNKISQYIKK